MYMPKGTIYIPNVWRFKLNRDPEIFGKNPDNFDTAQYLDAIGDKVHNTRIKSEVNEYENLGYGLGKRICFGLYKLLVNIAP